MQWPGSYVYVGDVPQWWLWPAYVGMLAVLTHARFVSWRIWAPAGLAWLCVGVAGVLVGVAGG